MKLEDEILISAYLDKETSDDERVYVENLLETDNDAREFMNQLIRTENQLEDFFSSEAVSEINESLEKKLIKSNSISNFIMKFVKKPWRILVLVLAAPLFFVAPVGYIAFNELEVNSQNKAVIVRSEKERLDNKCEDNSKLYNFFLTFLYKDYCKKETLKNLD